MMLDVIDAASWAVHPVRQILVSALRGGTYVHGPQVSSYLDEAQHGGLLSFRPVEAHEVPDVWRWRPEHAYYVTPTALGIDVALRIAYSEEICVVFDAYTEAKRWHGVDPGRLLTELDLRGGGDGHMSRWPKTASRCRHCLGKLPRRGIDDESGTAHQRD